ERLAGAIRSPGRGGLLLSTRLRNRDVDRRHRTEGGERSVEIGGFADDEDREVLLVDIFLRDPRHVFGGWLLDLAAIAVDKVERIAVELEGRLLAEDLRLRVESENEGVQERVLRLLQLVGGRRLGHDVLDLFDQRVDPGGRRLALGSQAQSKKAWVVVARADAAADRVGETFLRADV